MRTISLYIHLPFCTGKCSYCDFYSITANEQTIDNYLLALEAEAELVRKHFFANEKPSLKTIYMGGGTPSTLSPSQIEKLGNIIRDNFVIEENAEFTSEANPESASEDRLRAFMDIGVNRLSIGTQTFNEQLLKTIGRRHTHKQTIDAVETSKKVGIDNISLDLIFALPGQNISDFQADLIEAVNLSPKHLSCYELMLEPGTKLYEIKQAFSEEEEEINIKMFDIAHTFLENEKYEHYEISNFAREGQKCEHNLCYWQNGEYIGLGASAAGFIDGRRYKNIADVHEYAKRITTEKQLPAEYVESLSQLQRAGESAMLSLRTKQGIDRKIFTQQTGFDPFKLFAKEIDRFTKLGLLEADAGRIHLSLEGLKLSNEVLADFLR